MKQKDDEVRGDFYDLEYFLSLEYRYLSGALKSLVKYILSSLGDIKGKKILDVGCGGGYFSDKIFKMGANVISCDYSPSAIEFTKERYPHLKILNCSAYNIDNLGSDFDILVSINVIEHLGNPDLFLEKANKILKPNGKLFIVTDNEQYLFLKWPLSKLRKLLSYTSSAGRAYNLIKKVEKFRRSFKNYHQSHISIVDNKDLMNQIMRAGFKIKESKFFPSISIPFLNIPLKIMRPSRFFGGDFQIIIAQKNEK